MKKMNCLVTMLFCVFAGRGQSQDMQQLILDLEKLAQMRSMLTSMYNGYTTLVNGYNRISGLAKGNFDLHKNYLDGLLIISPAVSDYKNTAAVFSKRELAEKEGSQGYLRMLKSGVFTSKELTENKAYFDQLSALCGRKMQQMQMVLTSGSLRMSDSERIEAIDRINQDVGKILEAVRLQVKEKEDIMVRRRQRLRDVNGMKTLNGIK